MGDVEEARGGDDRQIHKGEGKDADPKCPDEPQGVVSAIGRPRIVETASVEIRKVTRGRV